MSEPTFIIGALLIVACYFFMAGVVAEHSSSNIYKDIGSPIPAIARGVLWPLVLLKYLMIMIWRDEF